MQLECGQIINDKWKVEKLFGETGQGQSALVSDILNGSEKGVIKALRNINSSVSTSRFKQEISLLNKMKLIDRIPNVLEINEEELYYIMQHIEGTDLEAAASSKRNRRNFDKIMTSIMNLLGIVESYSKLGILHRDIKPGNILCYKGNIEDIYLIDFGIGYDELECRDLTETCDQLGNRFLRLPELLNGNKHDLRSDITLCVGILFYILTNTVPVSLINEDEKMPHQTTKGIENLQWVGTKNIQILNSIFDKGFTNSIDERFQSVEDLIFALNKINILKINDKGRYRNTTDSYCLATIKNMFDVNVDRIGRGIERLKLYDQKRIALGNVHLTSLENNLLIHIFKFDLIKIIRSSYQYTCNDIDGLFIKKDLIKDEIFAKEDDLSFELSAKIKIEDKKITFNEFSVKNYLYEIPVNRIIEPIFRIKVENTFSEEKIMINNNEITILEKKNITIYNINKSEKSVYKINVDDLIDANSNYIISSDRKWIFYQNGNDFCIGEWNKDKFVKKKCDELSKLDMKNVIECVFCRGNLILLFKDRLVAIDIQNNTQVEYYNIRRGKFILEALSSFHIVSESGNYCYITNSRNKKILINFSSHENNKSGFFDLFDHIINSNNSRYIYKSNFETIIRINIENGNQEVLINQDNCSTRVNLNRIECENYNYFFSLNRYRENAILPEKGKIKICKIIDERWINICNIEDEEDIIKIWLCSSFLVSLSKSNQIVIWKING